MRRDAVTSFRTGQQRKGFVGSSILSKIPNFDIVNGFVIDYLHCMLLGGVGSLYIYGLTLLIMKKNGTLEK